MAVVIECMLFDLFAGIFTFAEYFSQVGCEQKRQKIKVLASNQKILFGEAKKSGDLLPERLLSVDKKGINSIFSHVSW